MQSRLTVADQQLAADLDIALLYSMHKTSSIPCRAGSRLTAADQQHLASLEVQIAQLQSNVDALTHPDAADEEEQQHAKAYEQQPDAEASIVADILTIARSQVFDNVHSRQARRSLADHLVDEANEEGWSQQQRQALEDMTEEEEMRLACATYDQQR